jgi:hypothetical protein
MTRVELNLIQYQKIVGISYREALEEDYRHIEMTLLFESLLNKKKNEQ